MAASKGYPEKFENLKEIKNLDLVENNNNQFLFHAGTIKNRDGKILSNGGRVLNSTVIATNLAEARTRALNVLDSIDWENKYYRRDIGHCAIKK